MSAQDAAGGLLTVDRRPQIGSGPSSSALWQYRKSGAVGYSSANECLLACPENPPADCGSRPIAF